MVVSRSRGVRLCDFCLKALAGSAWRLLSRGRGHPLSTRCTERSFGGCSSSFHFLVNLVCAGTDQKLQPCSLRICRSYLLCGALLVAGVSRFGGSPRGSLMGSSTRSWGPWASMQPAASECWLYVLRDLQRGTARPRSPFESSKTNVFRCKSPVCSYGGCSLAGILHLSYFGLDRKMATK